VAANNNAQVTYELVCELASLLGARTAILVSYAENQTEIDLRGGLTPLEWICPKKF